MGFKRGNETMKILKQLFCKHEWRTTRETDGAMFNIKTGIIHGGLTKEFRFCRKCNKKELKIVDEPSSQNQSTINKGEMKQ